MALRAVPRSAQGQLSEKNLKLRAKSAVAWKREARVWKAEHKRITFPRGAVDLASALEATVDCSSVYFKLMTTLGRVLH